MTVLCTDIETYSEADLKLVGTYRYAQDLSTEVLMQSYNIDGGVTKLWQPHEGKMPAELRDAMLDPHVEKRAWNAAFERNVLREVLGFNIPPEQWRCTMIKAYSLALPGSLEECGRIIGIAEDKQKLKDGKRLITKFCGPRTPTANNTSTRWTHKNAPEDWELFCRYCIRDTDSERAIEKRLSRWPMKDWQWKLWFLDQHINDLGLPIDTDFVRAAIRIDERHTERLMARACKLTGLDNPNSRTQLMDWLNKFQLGLTALTKDDVALALESADQYPDMVREVLEIRQQLARSSVTKFAALDRATGADCRLRGCFQYYGAARTGRWAGRIFQPQNLPKGKFKRADVATSRLAVASGELGVAEILFDDVGELLSSNVRPSVSAPEGKKILVTDFSAIEARVLAWMADEQWRIDVFKTHGKIYEASASRMFGIPMADFDTAEKAGGKHPARQKGKVAELALGFQGGAGALITMGALDMGLVEEELQPIVDAWREANPNIRQLWRDIGDAAQKAVVYKTPTVCRMFTFRRSGPFLFIDLPSGRSLAYLNPRMEPGKFGPEIVFDGVDQKTRQWGRQKTYGGKLVENLCQAIACDCLGVALTRLDASGLDIIGHVHDEPLLEIDETDTQSIHAVEKIMSTPMPWATGLPLGADAYECKHYVKRD